jgi:methyl-accepting chemotaxis protein
MVTSKALKKPKKRWKVRLSLQVKLTITIVILMFFIISLRTAAIEVAQQYLQDTIILNLVSAGVSILLGAIGAYFIIRFFIKKPLSKLTELAEHLAQNDLTKRSDLKTGDEFGTLSDMFNDMADQFVSSKCCD